MRFSAKWRDGLILFGFHLLSPVLPIAARVGVGVGVGGGAGGGADRPGVGSVTLVGAGPGDPDLLTVAAVKALAAADVVLFDHLVGDGILDLAPPGAERICVGKRSGRHSLPQEEINARIAQQALLGRRVVRLKGGDPMIFGRAGEEIDHLDALGIPVRVIPGITAALGCAASAGLSLTKRGVARAVTFVTAHGRDGERFEPDWARLASPDTTLAIYMGREQARAAGAGLRAAGLPGDTPVLAVENGCRPDERRVHTTLGAMAVDGVAAGKGPTLLLIGAALAARGTGEPTEVCGAVAVEVR